MSICLDPYAEGTWHCMTCDEVEVSLDTNWYDHVNPFTPGSHRLVFWCNEHHEYEHHKTPLIVAG